MKRAFVAIAIVGCTSSGQGTSAYTCMGGPPDANGPHNAVSSNGKCPTFDITGGNGTKLEGEACSSFDDCAQICCSCAPQSSNQGAISYCNNGFCATKEVACCAFAASTTCAP